MIKKYKNSFPQFDNTCYISESAVVTGNVKMGSNVSVWDCAVIRGDIDQITIDENTNIQDGSILHINRGIPLTIGKNVTVGHGVNLHGCQIGDNSLIGIGAIVLNNAIIGKNCIIGAGSLVLSNTIIPDGTMVLGSPGKIIRELNAEEIQSNTRNAMDYVQVAKEYMSELK